MNQLTKVQNSISTTEYTEYDILGRVTKSKQTTEGDPTSANNEMEYSYNLSGALVETKYPSGRVVRNELDNDGRLSIVQSKKNQNYGFWDYAKGFKYTAAGAVSDMQLGNGKWESTTFNSRLQPTQIALGTVQGGADKLKLDFEYNTGSNTDNNGNVLKQTIKVEDVGTYQGFEAVQTYTYDELNRLKTATENIDGNQTPSWKETNVFDRYGNKNYDESNTTTITKACGTSPNFVMCDGDRERENPEIDPANNRIKELQPDGDSNKDYEFDAAGNTIKDPDGREFFYDGENKQIKVEDISDNTIGQYWFDGDGKRVKKYVPSTGETTIFHYDAAGLLIAEYSTIVETSNPQVSYLTNDHLGSPRITTDKDGNVFSRRDFLPFGEELTSSHTYQRNSGVGYAADSVRQKFTGYERDEETELDFAEARMHSYDHGRFTTVDPMMGSADPIKPQTYNRYVYVLNNPLEFVDPTGLYECKGSTQQCNDFRASIDTATRELGLIADKYGKDSKEFKAAKKSLDAFGCESQNGVCVDDSGNQIKDVNGSVVKDTAKNVHVSFNLKHNTLGAKVTSNIGSGIISVNFGSLINTGLISNEGINVADTQDALATGNSVSLYDSEREGLFSGAVFDEISAQSNGRPKVFNADGTVLWDEAWEIPVPDDDPLGRVRYEREKSIDREMRNFYKLSPNSKKKVLTLPKTYKPSKRN